MRLTTSSAPAGPHGGDRARRRPDVLADRHPHQGPADPEELVAAPSRGEPALLVEDAVVGQQPLVVDADDPAPGADGGGVGQGRRQGAGRPALEAAAARPDARTRRRRRSRPRPRTRRLAAATSLQGGQVVGHEARLQEQVLGRVAGDGQLGEDAEVGPGRAGRPEGVEIRATLPARSPTTVSSWAAASRRVGTGRSYRGALGRTRWAAGISPGEMSRSCDHVPLVPRTPGGRIQRARVSVPPDAPSGARSDVGANCVARRPPGPGRARAGPDPRRTAYVHPRCSTSTGRSAHEAAAITPSAARHRRGAPSPTEYERREVLKIPHGDTCGTPATKVVDEAEATRSTPHARPPPAADVKHTARRRSPIRCRSRGRTPRDGGAAGRRRPPPAACRRSRSR